MLCVFMNIFPFFKIVTYHAVLYACFCLRGTVSQKYCVAHEMLHVEMPGSQIQIS